MNLNVNYCKTIVVLFSLFAIVSCNDDKNEVKDLGKNDLSTFEKQFSKSLDYEMNEGTKLIGFKSMKIDNDELSGFETLIKENPDKLSNYYLDKDKSVVRIYFPVEAALVEYNGTISEANKLGEIGASVNGADLFVVGRKQTDDIRGVEGNVIKDGIIYLAGKNKVDHKLGNVYVFDFGMKMMHVQHSGESRIASDKVSCMNNHGGPNCSDKFHIYKGRCPFNSRVCMDYNGWFTDCVNGKVSNFPGSDCDYALGAGHCWNEVM